MRRTLLKIELNKFINHLAKTCFQIRGVYRYKIKAGSKGSERAAPYPGFIFPLSGSSEYYFNNTPYRLSKETVFHGSGGGIIQKEVLGKSPWEFIVILYEPYTEPSDFELVNTHFIIPINQSPLLLDMLYQIHRVAQLPDGFSEFQVETLARRIFEETFLCARNQNYEDAQALFETVVEYIHNHYMEPLSVGFLAEQNNVNENRLSYVFQKYAGMGPGEYLSNYRLNRAKDLIITSSIPINKISNQVGYPDSLYFSRIFKKHFGLSPTTFRENSGKIHIV